VTPGQSFQIYFEVKNTGNTTWQPGSYWLQNLQSPLGASSTQPLSRSVLPNDTYRWTINLTAPTNPGTYRSQWMISHNGTTFGPNMFIDVTVQQQGTGLGCDQVSHNGVILYENKYCNRDQNGNSKSFSASTGWIDIAPDFNDITSSIYVAPGWSIKVFEASPYDYSNGAYGGSWRCITGSMWDLSIDYYTHLNTSQKIDETISSVQVFSNNSCTHSLTLNSHPDYDGRILESSETSGVGGSLNSDKALALGDDGGNRQYRTILGFLTSTIPDDAVITSAKLRIKSSSLTGTNPFNTHGALLVDVSKSAFSGNRALQIQDFQAVASKNAAFTIRNAPTSGWYFGAMNLGDLVYINKTGMTQFRLRFALDDNNDYGIDMMMFFSGNASNSADRPRLIITYYVP
jgi:hypothetical protein